MNKYTWVGKCVFVTLTDELVCVAEDTEMAEKIAEALNDKAFYEEF